MIDRHFIAALTFCLLAAGTLAVGSAWFEGKGSTAVQALQQQAPRVLQLPSVEVSGQRTIPGTAPGTTPGTAWASTEATEPATRQRQ